MKVTVASKIRQLVAYTCPFWSDRIKKDFGIECLPKEPGESLDPLILRQTYFILEILRPALIKDCGVDKLFFSSEMGPSKPKYPNHGFYIDRTVTLNNDVFYHPDIQDDFFDYRGYFFSRPAQTLIHEMAHGFDAAAKELSLKPEWLKLSGWSPTPQPGLQRLLIRDPGAPPVVGEWFYNPKAGFTRFYARRNPWDDFADSFSFYVAGMKSKLPENKREYFDDLLKKYR